ncbi:MAG: hypothetical protein GY702_13720 [Desulfobulbaceae bacterium]|nr:hypothetical protein [Desulfobulbaceae bacterium]
MPEINQDELARVEAQRQADLAEHQRQLAQAQAQADGDHELALERQMAHDQAAHGRPLDHIDHNPLRDAFNVDAHLGADVCPRHNRVPPAHIPNPPPGDAMAIIAASLHGLREQNDLLRRNGEFSARYKYLTRVRSDWFSDEVHKIDRCEGKPKEKFRMWLRGVKTAMNRLPCADPLPNTNDTPATVVKDQARKLVSRTAKGPLLANAELMFDKRDGKDVDDILQDLELLFLGTDDAAQLKIDLEDIRQPAGDTADSDLPTYVRTFRQEADMAYGILRRSAEVELKLADLFTTSLKNTDIAKELFEHDPPLLTLAEVQEKAMDIYSRRLHMKRAWKDRAQLPIRFDEPMEVDNMYNFNSVQNELINVQKRLANMERVNAKQQYNSAAPSLMNMQTRYTPPTSTPNTYSHGSSVPRGCGGRGINAGYPSRQQTA